MTDFEQAKREIAKDVRLIESLRMWEMETICPSKRGGIFGETCKDTCLKLWPWLDTCPCAVFKKDYINEIIKDIIRMHDEWMPKYTIDDSYIEGKI